jgi:hypothetical protein
MMNSDAEKFRHWRLPSNPHRRTKGEQTLLSTLLRFATYSSCASIGDLDPVIRESPSYRDRPRIGPCA